MGARPSQQLTASGSHIAISLTVIDCSETSGTGDPCAATCRRRHFRTSGRFVFWMGRIQQRADAFTRVTRVAHHEYGHESQARNAVLGDGIKCGDWPSAAIIAIPAVTDGAQQILRMRNLARIP